MLHLQIPPQPPVLALASDLVEHLNHKAAHLDTQTIINDGHNERAPVIEQYHHHGDDESNKSAYCERAPTTCELYPISNSHYDLIVSIQQIPSGGTRTRQRVQSSWLRLGANVGKRASSSNNNEADPFCRSVNDNQEASNESQESHDGGECGDRDRDYHSRANLPPIMSHWRDPGQLRVETHSNRIKSASCNTRAQFEQQRALPRKQPQLNHRKWSLSIIGQAEAIRLVRLEAPHSIQAGQQLKLRCLYETRGDKLQSLAYYRNGREFYRFQPFERRQPVLAFNSTGVHVDVS